MNPKRVSAVAVPTLLIFTAFFGVLSLKLDGNVELVSLAIFLFTLVYVRVLERIIPSRKDWEPNKRLMLTDLKYFFLSAAPFDALAKMIALAGVLYIQKQYGLNYSFWEGLPLPLTYLLANLIGEFLPYWYHRISHVGNKDSFLSLLCWKIHAIHHLPTSMNWFKSNWVHPINIFLNTFLKVAPLLLLGFSESVIFLVGITHVVIAYISHANIRTYKSLWDYVVVTPHIHHFHHSNKMEEAQNFGNVFPFWDLVFGTYYNREGNVAEVGVVEDIHINYPEATAFGKQLFYPLTTAKDCCR